jgi:malate dehydrogenase (oxaloacetate-decarboxylating)(NADP+)
MAVTKGTRGGTIMADEILNEMALQYHRDSPPGKLEVMPTKPLANQRDLALAYSPGVAAACTAIVDDPAEAATLTGRANLVAVVSNGTAVLGLGNIGALASKPVMEGKAVLFKKFAGINTFDIEVDETDPQKLVDIVCALEPTFGAINLEDIKAPDCFVVEEECRKRMNIPVFHDDQHGTAIVVGAALLNALRIVDKPIDQVKLVSTGGGAAGIACLNLMLTMGLKRENVWLCDHKGLIYTGRVDDMTPQKESYAQDSDLRELGDVIDGADVFMGLSAGGVLKAEMITKMADKPIILALANPVPEIDPAVVKETRPDAIVATGRSDYPNQVNNVLCFPFIFRGALDVGATTVTEEMKLAAVHAIADLAMAATSETVAKAYAGEELRFGPDYLIPKPFDQRLIAVVAEAVARAAMDSGVATRPIADFDAYRQSLTRFVFKSGMLMKPVIERAQSNPKRVVFAEGEDPRVLRAVHVAITDGVARPILVGRPDVVQHRIERMGLKNIAAGEDFDICNPESDPRFDDYWRLYHDLNQRDGISPDIAKQIVRTNTTVIAGLMLRRGEADAMICGVQGRFTWNSQYVKRTVGLAEGARDLSALSVLILPKTTVFLCDTHVTPDPSAEELAEMTCMAAQEVASFGVTPRVALLSHTNFGTYATPSSTKMRRAVEILSDRAPGLSVEGEMQGDVALDEKLRSFIFPNARIEGAANLLVFPNLDSANIAFNLLKSLGDGLSVGPILLGPKHPAHILTSSVSARGIFNMTAMAVAGAQAHASGG